MFIHITLGPIGPIHKKTPCLRKTSPNKVTI
nr:MAG TPA: hypothetical protein [Caudoviricetes sp.]